MFAAKKPRKRGTTGIDIGSHSIKVLESVIADDVVTITRFGIAEYSPNTPSQEVFDNLKAVLREVELTGKDVHISLSGPDTLSRFITVPAMKPDELKNSLKFEADKYIPFSLDDVNIDSVMLDRTVDSSGQMKVLLAAAKKSLINQRIAMFDKLGLNVTLVDLDTFAVLNGFIFSNKNELKDSIYAVIDIGQMHTDVIICKGEAPAFIREIQIGGLHIQKYSQEQTSGSAQAAEREDALRDAASRLGEEMRLSFGYFENQFGSPVEKIYLCGTVGNITGFISCLEESLGIKPILWDPLSKFVIGSTVDTSKIKRARYSLAVCAGLIIRNSNKK